MADSNYYRTFVVTVAYLLVLLNVLKIVKGSLFLFEAFMFSVLLIMGILLLYAVHEKKKHSFLFSSAYFALATVNSVYLYVSKAYMYSIIVLALAGVYGFVTSVKRIGEYNTSGKGIKSEIERIQKEINNLRSKSEIIEKELHTIEKAAPKIIIEEYDVEETKEKEKKDRPKRRNAAKGRTRKAAGASSAKRSSAKRSSRKKAASGRKAAKAANPKKPKKKASASRAAKVKTEKKK